MMLRNLQMASAVPGLAAEGSGNLLIGLAGVGPQGFVTMVGRSSSTIVAVGARPAFACSLPHDPDVENRV